MKTADSVNFDRIAQAIEYIKTNYKDQPNLDEIAQKVNMSPFHFQKLFTDWAGVSPKKFIQYLTLEHAKQILAGTQSTLFDAAYQSGLSGTGRLHDLFVTIEGMTPGDYKNGGENLAINYSFTDTPFGTLLVASTPKGICQMAFVDDTKSALEQLREKFPNAAYTEKQDALQENALLAFTAPKTANTIKLHLKGTPFQLKVWQALLTIPSGALTSYGTLAKQIEAPKASRAVGTAIGDNPVAFIIPCHRVIQSGGMLGGYHWGPNRKAAIIGWEAAKTEI